MGSEQDLVGCRLLRQKGRSWKDRDLITQLGSGLRAGEVHTLQG